MRYAIVLSCLVGLSACGGPAPEPEASDPGAAQYRSVCQDCHGPEGAGQGRFPKLAGRPAGELAGLLRQYKSGHKSVNMSDTMRPFAQALSEAQIDQVAAWLATR